MRYLTALLLGLSWVASVPAQVSSEHALQLLQAEAYDEAIEVYRRVVAAQPENARAHYDLAAALGFLRRYPEAVQPIEEAIRLAPDFVQAYQAASIIYANNHADGLAFEANLKAANLGESTAMFELVWMYRDGRGVDPDPGRSLFWAERAAQAGHVAAMDTLVGAYLNGDFGARVDAQRAGHWALRAWQARRPGR